MTVPTSESAVLKTTSVQAEMTRIDENIAKSIHDNELHTAESSPVADQTAVSEAQHANAPVIAALYEGISDIFASLAKVMRKTEAGEVVTSQDWASWRRTTVRRRRNGREDAQEQEVDGKRKRAPTAFILFSKDERAKLKESQPKLTSGEMFQTLGQLWKNAPDSVRAEYQELARISKSEPGEAATVPMMVENQGLTSADETHASVATESLKMTPETVPAAVVTLIKAPEIETQANGKSEEKKKRKPKLKKPVEQSQPPQQSTSVPTTAPSTPPTVPAVVIAESPSLMISPIRPTENVTMKSSDVEKPKKKKHRKLVEQDQKIVIASS